MSGEEPAETLRTRWRLALPIGGSAFLVLALFLAQPFTLFQYTLALAYGIGVLGLKLLTGYNGQFSLGHSALFAAGAYAAAALTHAGVDAYLTLPLAAAVGFALGVLIGLPAIRVRGHQLGLATFALALAAPQFARSTVLAPITGGSAGISTVAPAIPWGMGTDVWWYGVALACAAACSLATVVLLRSRFGRAMQASRDNALAAEAIGIDTRRVDVTAFGISGAFAGLGGALAAVTLGYIGPDSFPFTLAIMFFMAAIVTGPRSIAGAFVGGFIILFLPNWAEALSSPDLIWATYGLLLLVLLYGQARGRDYLRRLMIRWNNRVGGKTL